MIDRILLKFAGFLNRIAKRNEEPVKPNELAEMVALWKSHKGDKLHRLNYPLDNKSIVFDLGGYEGDWSSDIFSKYLCNIYIFEPFPPYAAFISERFLFNRKIKVFNFGLAAESSIARLNISDDASSIFKSGDDAVVIELLNFEEFLVKHQIDHIDLLKINIEGAEYDVLEHLIKTSLVTRIRNIQVQFHNFVPDAEQRMGRIQEMLGTTHRLTYQYKFVWENWTIRSD